MTNDLSRNVQMQFMRPGQVEAAGKQFPVVYVPFGLIEWHGRHLPLGTDALKAHGIAVKAAEKFGGVVYPPVYFHSSFDQEHMRPILTELFERLRNMGFRVIVAISGHNTQSQIDMMEQALRPVLEARPIKIEDTLYRPAPPGSAAGIGVWEMTLSQCEESQSDHAAKWETSNMMFFYPEQVDLSELGTGPLAPGMKAPDGIGGLDPRVHASPAVGCRNVELAAEAIGRKAQELLASLPEGKREFGLQKISPETWWMI